jgi:6,7-dimethyl-8-ribityllumazine synthase
MRPVHVVLEKRRTRPDFVALDSSRSLVAVTVWPVIPVMSGIASCHWLQQACYPARVRVSRPCGDGRGRGGALFGSA